MDSTIIFVIGALVTVITIVAVALVGVLEASNPENSRPRDLADWEWRLVKEARARNTTGDESR
jgi:hypothetical protein